MHVQAIVTARPKAMIRAGHEDAQQGPLQAQTHQADLAAVRVSREDEIRFALWQVTERARIVQKHDAQAAGNSRVAGGDARQVLATVTPDEVHAQDLYWPG